MATRMLQRRGTAAEWAASNPILGEGEVGIDKDVDDIKIGDGLTHWADLPFLFVHKRLVDAKGDLIVGSGPDAVSKLPAGSNGQHLEVAADGSLVWVTMPNYALASTVAATYETLTDIATRMPDKSSAAEQDFAGNVKAPAVLDASGRVYSPGNPPPGNIAMSLVDAKGDLIVGTADNTVARLPVGTDRQILRARSTQTAGVAWETDNARRWTRSFMMMGA